MIPARLIARSHSTVTQASGSGQHQLHVHRQKTQAIQHDYPPSSPRPPSQSYETPASRDLHLPRQDLLACPVLPLLQAIVHIHHPIFSQALLHVPTIDSYDAARYLPRAPHARHSIAYTPGLQHSVPSNQTLVFRLRILDTRAVDQGC
jgi:hypothetical protein